MPKTCRHAAHRATARALAAIDALRPHELHAAVEQLLAAGGDVAVDLGRILRALDARLAALNRREAGIV
jgi:hypothetical protein